MSEKWLEILFAPARERLTVTEICRRYGISRKTFYVYRDRYRVLGLPGLEPRSRRPKHSPSRTSAEVESLIVEIRRERPYWGARRIHSELARRGPGPVPVVSTVHTVLRRHGLLTGVRQG